VTFGVLLLFLNTAVERLEVNIIYMYTILLYILYLQKENVSYVHIIKQ